MSRNWSLILVVAFSLGYGLKLYLDSSSEQTTTTSSAVFQGEQKTVDLFDEQDPRTRIVYFGFTHCPDVCPTSLAMLSGALKQLNAEQLAQLRPIFITLDPERDIASKAHQYAQYFHPKIEGLSAPIEITKPIAEKYGVVFRKTELPDSQLQYTIDHNSYFYLLQPNGELIAKVPHTLNPAPIVAAIEQLKTQ
ncbi:cytochrome oxidase biogenesis protein Sco1/SenC/PrrC [Vibrio ponticus]|nr:cytochrome oxidase biogenesis protein Sco1/SenC/PrrC [Vibrio ponticus]